METRLNANIKNLGVILIQTREKCENIKRKNTIIIRIHRFQKKPEVSPKRGLIALAVSGKYEERSSIVTLSSMIFQVLV